MSKVFLSGAVEGESDYGDGWRAYAATRLRDRGFEILNPVSVRLEQAFTRVNEIVHRNLFLQRQADILLVEYNIPNRAYIGTDFEMAAAHRWQQPAIVWAHETHMNRVYLQYLATSIHSKMDEAIDYVIANYSKESYEQ